ncbi:MAG TPA: hypothetical protein VGF04_01760 [Solirubrobacterales bacterium]|jgi:hypothetical protein
MADQRIAPRLSRLPTVEIGGVVVPVASDARSRLLGLALLDRSEAGHGLLIPGCASVHSYGMRFPLLLAFLDEESRLLSLRFLPPRRFARHRGAAAVLEIATG